MDSAHESCGRGSKLRVVVLGGYGFFGRRLVQRLALHSNLELIVSGRSLAKAESLVQHLNGRNLAAELCSSRLDATAIDLHVTLQQLGADVLVHTCGPFQHQDYHVAQACIQAGCHYIDLSDGREFVAGIRVLDTAAKAAGVVVLSGASSVPALSGAVIEHLRQDMVSMTSIDIGISPGNRTDRGLATIAAILSYCGAPIKVWRDGIWQSVTGWGGHWRHRYPDPVGMRWLTYCEVPDLSLLPEQYPDVRTVRFGAGLELNLLHWGLASLSWFRHLGLLPNLSRWAPQLKRLSEIFLQQGSEAGAMHVEVSGQGQDGTVMTRRWQLVADRGDGPYVPTLAAAALIQRIVQGDTPSPGAKPCLGVLTVADFQLAAAGLAIRMEST